jgi:hypothetical protein
MGEKKVVITVDAGKVAVDPMRVELSRRNDDTVAWSCKDGDFTVTFDKDKLTPPANRHSPFKSHLHTGKRGKRAASGRIEFGGSATYGYSVEVALADGSWTEPLDPEVVISDEGPAKPRDVEPADDKKRKGPRKKTRGRAKKKPKPTGKKPKPTGKKRKPTGKKRKPTRKKPTGKKRKPAGKKRKPSAGRSRKRVRPR